MQNSFKSPENHLNNLKSTSKLQEYYSLPKWQIKQMVKEGIVNDLATVDMIWIGPSPLHIL